MLKTLILQDKLEFIFNFNIFNEKQLYSETLYSLIRNFLVTYYN